MRWREGWSVFGGVVALFRGGGAAAVGAGGGWGWVDDGDFGGEDVLQALVDQGLALELIFLEQLALLLDEHLEALDAELALAHPLVHEDFDLLAEVGLELAGVGGLGGGGGELLLDAEDVVLD